MQNLRYNDVGLDAMGGLFAAVGTDLGASIHGASAVAYAWAATDGLSSVSCFAKWAATAPCASRYYSPCASPYYSESIKLRHRHRTRFARSLGNAKPQWKPYQDGTCEEVLSWEELDQRIGGLVQMLCTASKAVFVNTTRRPQVAARKNRAPWIGWMLAKNRFPLSTRLLVSVLSHSLPHTNPLCFEVPC